jgi:phosphoserine phosphatase RsbU/P
MRILFAEDDTISRKSLTRWMTGWGYEVVPVENGIDAWEILQGENPPKLILLDWMMPGLDGIEVCRRVKRPEKDVFNYVILLSGRDDQQDIVDGLEAGSDDYITKPFRKNELRARLDVGRRFIEMQLSLVEKEKLQGIIEMAGAVCHELNQPLQVVSASAEMLAHDIEPEHPMFGKVERIMKQVERMGEITRKLMNVTRYETKDYLTTRIVDIEKSTREED